MKLPDLENPSDIAGLRLNEMDDAYALFRKQALRQILWEGIERMFIQFPQMENLYMDSSLLFEGKIKVGIRTIEKTTDYEAALNNHKVDHLAGKDILLAKKFDKAFAPVRKQLGMKREGMFAINDMFNPHFHFDPIFAIERKKVPMLKDYFLSDINHRNGPGLQQHSEALALDRETPQIASSRPKNRL